MGKQQYQWAVVGAGPAGIASVGKLLDSGVDSKSIVWIDPMFSVGDFGTLWEHVSSNTKVELFHRFYHAYDAFNFKHAPGFDINRFDAQSTCTLQYAAEPLRWITQQLLKKVTGVQDTVGRFSTSEHGWLMQTKLGKSIQSKNVILATGSEPRDCLLDDIETIPLQLALDKDKLKKAVQGKNKIAVFGSSHSAIIVVRDLLDLGLKKVVNFYLSPLRYAKYFDDWILFDNTGLKGKTAEWARENLHGNLPQGLTRHLSTPENIRKYCNDIDAAIYATGFKRRALSIAGLPENFVYNQQCGVIAPGMFGIGIAFPEKTIDRYGNEELNVGLWKFMLYINKVMPLWMGYGL